MITGGGVTAGIDFALTLVAEIAGEDAARSIQLSIEYDPQPRFDAGSPETAPRYRGARPMIASIFSQSSSHRPAR